MDDVVEWEEFLTFLKWNNVYTFYIRDGKTANAQIDREQLLGKWDWLSWVKVLRNRHSTKILTIWVGTSTYKKITSMKI